jgi:ubiquitin carboxyl-terminal hydrolase 48
LTRSNGLTALAPFPAQYLCEERLDGDNQYQCDFCGHRTDATRRVRLHSLPPYLCFQLKRFVFDMQTFERKKVGTALLFLQGWEGVSLRGMWRADIADELCR